MTMHGGDGPVVLADWRDRMRRRLRFQHYAYRTEQT